MDRYQANIAGCVSIVGWFGRVNGEIHDLYFNLIKKTNTLDPHTKITGNMIEDLQRADPFEISKEVVLKVITNKRLLSHGDHDLRQLGITAHETSLLNIEFVDTSRLYNTGTDNNPIALAKLSDFFDLKFWDRSESRSLVQGHSSERDARATLKCYQRTIKLLNKYGRIPMKREIKDYIQNGKTWLDWEKNILHPTILQTPVINEGYHDLS